MRGDRVGHRVHPSSVAEQIGQRRAIPMGGVGQIHEVPAVHDNQAGGGDDGRDTERRAPTDTGREEESRRLPRLGVGPAVPDRSQQGQGCDADPKEWNRRKLRTDRKSGGEAEDDRVAPATRRQPVLGGVEGEQCRRGCWHVERCERRVTEDGRHGR